MRKDAGSLRWLFFSLVIAIILLLFSFIPQTASLIHPYCWYLFLFFTFQSYVTIKITDFGAKNKDKGAIYYYFLASIVRMFLCIIVAFIFIYQKVQAPILFVGNFFILYLCFTGFEIYALLRKLRTNLKPPQENA